MNCNLIIVDAAAKMGGIPRFVARTSIGTRTFILWDLPDGSAAIEAGGRAIFEAERDLFAAVQEVFLSPRMRSSRFTLAEAVKATKDAEGER